MLFLFNSIVNIKVDRTIQKNPKSRSVSRNTKILDTNSSLIVNRKSVADPSTLAQSSNQADSRDLDIDIELESNSPIPSSKKSIKHDDQSINLSDQISHLELKVEDVIIFC